jgi:branched-chain amino acid transport system ATP-binding protein
MSALEVRGLCKAYGGVQAVKDVSFALDPSEVVALIGPNGAGKTTCFNLLNGQLAPDAGDILVGGASVAGLPAHRIARMGVGRTFQITQTFGSMSVRENVQVALLSYHHRIGSLFAAAPKLHRDEAQELLERVGMASQAERPCAVLAYGDLKRVELAAALAGRPRVLLMDEPTAGMAPEERGLLMELAAEVAHSERIAVLFTEHDMSVVFGHAARIIVLHQGEIIASGSAGEVRSDAKVREVYLGDA